MWALSHVANQLIHGLALPEFELVLFVSAWFFRVLLLEIKQQICVGASLQLRQSIRSELLKKLIVAGPLRKAFGTDSELSTLVLEKVDALDGFISRYWVQQFLVVVTPFLISIAVCWYSLLSAVIMVLTAPLVIVFMILVGKEASLASAQQLTHLSRMGGRFYDFILGLRTLRQFKALDIAQKQLEKSAEEFQKSSFTVLRMAFLSTAVLELFSSLAIALVALYLGLGLIGELPWHRAQVAVSYQPALFILLLAPEFYAPLRQLGADYHAKALAVAATEDLYQLWQAPSQPFIAGDSAIEWKDNSEIVFHDVVVGSEQQPRLQISNLTIKSGQHWLITGNSGSGKTTLLQLLCGFWQWQGNIKVADLLFNELNIEQWRQKIGYLHQKPEFLPGTIANNLRIVKPKASEEQLYQCLYEVGLISSSRNFSDFLQLQLIDNAANLSGGEQQRLAIARLLLSEKPIWLLDEPWVHLDPDNAKALILLIQRCAKHKTVILVSHQLEHLEWLTHRFQLMPKDSISDSHGYLTEVVDV